MDPTMGETNLPVVFGQTNGATEPAPQYPIGRVDFNKPFVVVDSYDDENAHSNARILAVLAGNGYPVVIVSQNEHDEEVVHQYDTDGDALDVDLKVKNIETGPVVKYVMIERIGLSFSVVDGLYDSETDARNDRSDALFAILPITIPAEAQVFTPVAEVVEDTVEDEEQNDGDIEDTTDVVTEIANTLPDGAVRVNGTVYQAGDKAYVYRAGFGQRLVNVLKTRTTDPFKSLFVQADDGTNAYWALNKNVRYKVSN